MLARIGGARKHGKFAPRPTRDHPPERLDYVHSQRLVSLNGSIPPLGTNSPAPSRSVSESARVRQSALASVRRTSAPR